MCLPDALQAKETPSHVTVEGYGNTDDLVLKCMKLVTLQQPSALLCLSTS